MAAGLKTYILKKFVDNLDKLTISDHNGLSSPGLTCYLNSVLQVLFMTSQFRDAVKSSRKNAATFDWHLAELFYALEKTVSRTHALLGFLDVTDVYEQQDAAEYFEKILRRSSPEASEIFQGQLEQNTKCLGCHEGNQSLSFFWLLPLPMGNLHRETFDVSEGLKSFFKEQKVSGADQLYCTRCRKKQNAEMKCKVIKIPDVFTLLLKRFSFDEKRQRYGKLHCDTAVPRTLRLETCWYELYAVVHHCGTLRGGHYTADIKSFETGLWYCFNDDIVRTLRPQPFTAGEKSLRSYTAYLLLYRKCESGFC